ncbi:HD domain-containing phosphohydrolase [Acetivibrio cellulolyticus]|uniref:HD domain-containing phosphohydrolase n=1 Tax=Acetivibrio cellulolyticus TaxID=35830 RepID=UPI0001E2DEC4|nr:HD domain-containing phosphohydrolase [Acetivibrio cellulolyticus]
MANIFKEGKNVPTIGFVVSDLRSYYAEHLGTALKNLTQKYHINILIFPCRFTGIEWDHQYQYNTLIDLINKKNLDGIILASASFMGGKINKKEIFEYIRYSYGIPVVSIGVELDNIPSLIVNNSSGIKEAIRHLVNQHNIRKIGFLRGSIGNDEADERFNAYIEELKDQNIPFNPDIIFNGNFLQTEATEVGKNIISSGIFREIEAIISANDEMALGLIPALYRGNLRIPKDMKIIGFDDIESSRSYLPPLTTIRQPLYEIAEESVNIILSMLSNKPVKKKYIFDTSLVIRSSCGCLIPKETSQRFLSNEKSSFDKNSNNHSNEQPMNKKDMFDALFKDKEIAQKLQTIFSNLSLENPENIDIDDFLQEFYCFLIENSTVPDFFENIKKASIKFFENFYHKEIFDSNNNGLNYIYQNVLHLINNTNNNIQTSMLINNFMNLRSNSGKGVQNIIYKLNFDALIYSLVDHLHRELEFNNFYIGLYEKPIKHSLEDKWEIPDSIELIIASKDGESNAERVGVKYSLNDHLLPVKFFPKTKNFIMVVKPLYFEEEHFGIMIIDYVTDSRVLYNLLTHQISSAIKFTQLITEHKEIESMLIETNNKLKELDQAKTDFFSNVSHELRTPLTIILGQVEAVLSGQYYKNTLEPNSDIFKTIQSNALRLLKLINTLLDFSKIQAGKMTLNRQPVNINRFLSSYISAVKSSASQKNINMIFVDNADDTFGFIDKDLFEAVIANLISNALKFTDSEGYIIIELNKLDTSFEIVVKDSGIGIPKDKLDTIFDRFSQIENSKSSKVRGTGIGLAYTKEIVELHEGKISVSSILGKGSVFAVSLPVCESKNASKCDDIKFKQNDLITDLGIDSDDSSKEVILDVNKNTVLVIDDTKDMRNLFTVLLQNEYNLITCKNGVEGIDKSIIYKPDIIITDFMMPEMDGLEFIKHAKTKKELRGLPIIIVTAKTMDDVKLTALKEGAIDFIFKPFSQDELKAKIKSNIEMKKLRDSIEDQRNALNDEKNLLQEVVNAQTKEIISEKNIALNLKKLAEQQLEGFLFSLATAIESKDHYTGEHVERVSNYSRDLALAINLPEKEVREIFLGSIVHDVGKIGIKDNILNKPSKLTEEEFEEIKKHPEIGKKVLSKLVNMEEAINIVYCHHEKWNGKGYPSGLKGLDIPISSRIVTIADYWDAIITDRPYRKAIPIKEALKIMRSESAQTFDPDILNIFLDPDNKLFLRYISNEMIQQYYDE